MKPFNDLNRMRTYAGDVFSGRNTGNWFVTGAKLVSMPLQCVSGIPIYDSLDRMDEDIEKAKKVAEVEWQLLQMNPVERAKMAFRGGAVIYNHYNAVFYSEEGVAQLFYKGGYGVGAVTGVATDFIVTDAVAQELTQIGGRFGGKLKGLRNVEGGTGTNTLTDAQKSRLNTLDNIIDHNLTESDFSGTLRDLQGNPVPNPQGGYYDHLTEMSQSYTALNKIRGGLEGALKNPNLSSVDREILQNGLDKANFYIQRIEELFEPFGGIK